MFDIADYPNRLPTTIYGASDTKLAPQWLELRNMPGWKERQASGEINWSARWLNMLDSTTITPMNSKLFWEFDLEDVASSDVVMVWAPSLDFSLRGALVEAGFALGRGIPVLAVGPADHPGFGTWQYHPSVFRCISLDEALSWLNTFSFRSE